MDDSIERSVSFELTQDAPFAAFMVDTQGTLCAWNTAAEALFGVPSLSAVGRQVGAVLPVSGGEAAWKELLAEGRGARRVWTTRRLDRPPVTCEWWLQPVRSGALIYAQDLSGRAAVPSKQQRIESLLLRGLLDNLEIIAWVCDRKGEVVLHEGKGLEGLGWKPGELLGQNLLELYRDNSPELVDAFEGKAGRFGSVVAGRDYDNYHIPMRDEHGDFTAVIGVSLDVTESKRREAELQDKIDLIERQQQALREMSTPIIEVWDHVITLPIVGLVDTARTAEIMDSLLQAVARTRARFAILDLTGVDVVDTSTASHLIGLIRAIRLLGAEGILTGIHPNIAQTVVTLGVDLSGLLVRSTLRDALKYVLAALDRPRQRVTSAA